MEESYVSKVQHPMFGHRCSCFVDLEFEIKSDMLLLSFCLLKPLEANEYFPPAVVSAPAAQPPCSSLIRGFHRAALRLQDESKADKPPSSSPSSTPYHEHYRAHSAEQEAAGAPQEHSASEPAAEEASRPNTRSVCTERSQS